MWIFPRKKTFESWIIFTVSNVVVVVGWEVMHDGRDAMYVQAHGLAAQDLIFHCQQHNTTQQNTTRYTGTDLPAKT